MRAASSRDRCAAYRRAREGAGCQREWRRRSRGASGRRRRPPWSGTRRGEWLGLSTLGPHARESQRDEWAKLLRRFRVSIGASADEGAARMWREASMGRWMRWAVALALLTAPAVAQSEMLSMPSAQAPATAA